MTPHDSSGYDPPTSKVIGLPAGAKFPGLTARWLELLKPLALTVWCGGVSGFLEVGTIVLRKHTFDSNYLYGMTRQFVWMIPLTNTCVFVAIGIVAWPALRAWPRRRSWLTARMLCALTILPPLLVALPQIYGVACVAIALGIATKLVPALDRHAGGFHRLVRVSFPALAALIPILAAGFWGSDRVSEWRERSRLLPPPGSPNVLLIVLDSVAAAHLSLHGYDRPTSPTMDGLAQNAVRFDSAQATSSWTLPSHAGMFTGRSPHELSAGWLTPLDASYPTLAEFLATRGYATAGFVANTSYCALDSGLGRGFATYQDYIFPQLSMFRMAALVERFVAGLEAVEQFLEDWLDFDRLRPAVQRFWLLFNGYRKDGALINREFLDWLSRRRQPERPFFVFLNYFDAHWPYELRNKGIHRFGIGPRDSRESKLIHDWSLLDQGELSTQDLAFVRDAYDDCVADLDEQFGRLIDELGRRDVLGKTWVIVTADHGESFGEHAGVFCHGTSLYQTELHVPLLILSPSANRHSPSVIKQTVSLQDLAATIVDIAVLKPGSPFPGHSLARFWSQSCPPGAAALDLATSSSSGALAEVVPNDPLLHIQRDQRRGPESYWPIAALVEGGWSYVRREQDAHEELFHVRDDPKETHNLASDPATRPRLDQMRKTLSRSTAGPLTPQRFRP